MNSIKKILFMLLALAICIASFAACSSDDNGKKEPDNTDKPHTHTPSEDWFADQEQHWHRCTEDGEKIDPEKHTMSAGACTVCKAKIAKHLDHYDASFYNSLGNRVRTVHNLPDGKITEDKMEYVYKTGTSIIEMIKTYTDGKLVSEAEYKPTADNQSSYEAKIVTFNEDGTKTACEYDESGDMIKEIKYSANGEVTSDLSIKHEYDEKGRKKFEKTYSGDKLVKQAEYIITSEDSWGGFIYNIRVTTYNADGTTTVKTYDENGNEVK